jgi:hypothetical protein
LDAIWHSRLTTAATVVVVGMAAGHVTVPYAPSAGAGARVAFWGVVVAAGALRGGRDGVVRDLVGRPLARRVALTALAAALLALAGYWAMHGAPKRL